jgi:hypothetical protein
LFAGVDVTLTSSTDAFYSFAGPKINYSRKKFTSEEFQIYPSGLLFQNGIQKQDINCSEWNDLKVFFLTNGDLPFDIFSASFYLLSRYEEYLPHKKDSYGRFAHEESLAFKQNLLQLPLADLWKQCFFNLLEEKFPALIFSENHFTYLPTYDIDIAYASKGKGWLRKLVSKFRREVTQVNGKDAFDIYDWLGQLHEDHQLSPLFFFLVARRRSKYDKNLSPKSKELQELIRKTVAKYDVAVHPSWQSFFDETEVANEINALQKITSQKVKSSRQHYIQFTLPHTYRCLINAGITGDYSMGYGSINGFRASCSTPFFWYDLMKEEQTALQLHPFCYMEANSYFEQKLSAEEAANELQHYHDIVKQVNGTLITIFHNHFLTQQEQWKPWRTMYENFLQKNFPQPITSPSQQEQ